MSNYATDYNKKDVPKLPIDYFLDEARKVLSSPEAVDGDYKKFWLNGKILPIEDWPNSKGELEEEITGP